MAYPPLEFAKAMSINSISEKHSIRKVLMHLDGKENDAILFLTSNEMFLNPEYTGEFEELNQWLIKNRQGMYHNMYNEPGKIELGTEEDKGAAADCILPYLIAGSWARNKQIYTFDPELESMLADIDEIKLPIRILDRVPFQDIYIQFSSDGDLARNFHGAFVKIMPYRTGYCISVVRIRDDLKAMTGFYPFVPDGDDPEADFIINKDTDIQTSEEGSHVDFRRFCMFFLNALLYLCSENAEIRENEVTRKTYRPSKTVKNKFSEIQINECGYVYGSMVRKQRKDHESKASENAEKAEEENAAPIQHRSHPVRAHVRKAHWHHYWTGKGRKELVLRWIAPTPVGYGEKLANIHKVTEK